MNSIYPKLQNGLRRITIHDLQRSTDTTNQQQQQQQRQRSFDMLRAILRWEIVFPTTAFVALLIQEFFIRWTKVWFW